MSLTREAFLLAVHAGIKVETLDVPGLGLVCVRAMTGGHRDRFEELYAESPHRDVRTRLLVLTICDEQGNLLFTEADIPAIGALPIATVDLVFKASARLNDIAVNEAEEAPPAVPSEASPCPGPAKAASARPRSKKNSGPSSGGRSPG